MQVVNKKYLHSSVQETSFKMSVYSSETSANIHQTRGHLLPEDKTQNCVQLVVFGNKNTETSHPITRKLHSFLKTSMWKKWRKKEEKRNYDRITFF